MKTNQATQNIVFWILVVWNVVKTTIIGLLWLIPIINFLATLAMMAIVIFIVAALGCTKLLFLKWNISFQESLRDEIDSVKESIKKLIGDPTRVSLMISSFSSCLIAAVLFVVTMWVPFLIAFILNALVGLICYSIGTIKEEKA